jgi:hypothetical protein
MYTHSLESFNVILIISQKIHLKVGITLNNKLIVAKIELKLSFDITYYIPKINKIIEILQKLCFETS